MNSQDYTMNFENLTDAVACYELVKLPVAGQSYFAGFRYADNGQKVRIFARQHLAAPNTFTFSERYEDICK
jgi:hypothetical protein